MRIDIIIPNYNGKILLPDCLHSLQQQTCSDFSIIVVDNGSVDGSQEYLRSEFPEVQLIALNENTGFSAAVNAGISAGSAPLIFLLNNDTELAEDCLAELLAAAEKKEEFDFFAAKMLNFHDRSRLDGAGEGFLRGGVGYRLGTMEKDGEQYSVARQVFGACAGAALYRRAFFEELGLFDEDFFAYLEDVDLNLRANSRKKKCWYVPSARVYHIGSATTGSKINAFTVSLSTRNNFNVLLKNYPFILLLRFLPVICVYQFFWFCFVVKKEQFAAYCKGLAGFVKLFPAIVKKRKHNLQLATVDAKMLGDIMRAAERDVVTSIMRRREENDQGNGLFSLYLRCFL